MGAFFCRLQLHRWRPVQWLPSYAVLVQACSRCGVCRPRKIERRRNPGAWWTRE